MGVEDITNSEAMMTIWVEVVEVQVKVDRETMITLAVAREIVVSVEIEAATTCFTAGVGAAAETETEIEIAIGGTEFAELLETQTTEDEIKAANSGSLSRLGVEGLQVAGLAQPPILTNKLTS